MRTRQRAGLLVGLFCASCGGQEFANGGSGGAGTGGESAVTSGGATMQGGSAGSSSGGTPATGGTVASGGVGLATGGVPASGGHPAGGSATGGDVPKDAGLPSGGIPATGGTVGTGGSVGGSPGTGGTAIGGNLTTGDAATGGQATGGTNVGGTATGGTGASTGGAGGSGGYPECTTAKDCALLTDCCSCLPMPVGFALPTCNLVCIQSNCDARGIMPDEVACIAGRCAFTRTCDPAAVICDGLVPSCAAGEAPLVISGCYSGGCAQVEDCSDVGSCDVCKGAALPCATFEVRPPSYHCVTTPRDCVQNPTCACMGVCSGVMSCVQPDSTDLTCQCPVC